jgi:hypothetical protein
MESHEVLKETIKSKGAKAVAAEMGLSTSLVYKWCESHKHPGEGGADNPLDRLLKICEVTNNRAPVEWLCRKVGGFLVQNPESVVRKDQPVIKVTQSILKEFAEVLEKVSSSYGDDGHISDDEAREIRQEWEELKQIAESFVTACESGAYGSPKK